ncbi:MAG: tRNA pseudouridine(55) synthase TruB [Chloroflexota bacterium]
MNGILAVDKPKGLTSHDVVARVRRWSGQRRVGHAGTLDPMATGVLLVCLGEATRVSDDLMRGAKWYLARIRFGVRTTTDDAMGEAIERRASMFSDEDLEHAARLQVGYLEQVPPAFAAIKLQGRPVYKAARAGEEVILAARSVVVTSLTILSSGQDAADPDSDCLPTSWADVVVSCGKGTYIRAIARDLGNALGCGGHLAGLRRLASGAITTRQCASVADLGVDAGAEGPPAVAKRLLPLDYALDDRPAALLGAGLERQARSGRVIAVPGVTDAAELRLYGESGEAAAVARAAGAGLYHPDRVFSGETE